MDNLKDTNFVNITGEFIVINGFMSYNFLKTTISEKEKDMLLLNEHWEDVSSRGIETYVNRKTEQLMEVFEHIEHHILYTAR